MADDRVQRLMHEAVAYRYTRRQIFKRAAALGLSAPALAAAMAAAAPAGTFAQDADNPLGVDPEAPLDVVIFRGGYGDEYAINVNEMYQSVYPDVEITYAGIQRLAEQLQPRFVAGNPPDVIDNSGAGNLDNAVLVAEGQLADLADLMEAPAYDTEGATFAETLVPGTQETGVFDGTQYYLNYALAVYGIWYSSTFMEEHGFTYPQTWDEMLDLSEEIQGMGMSAWTHTGVYPQYMKNFVFDQMVWKHGGPEVSARIDNLEEDAWRQPEVREVLEALYQLTERDLILPGSEGLTHTESQAEWLQGNAAFIPVGSWLENEMEGLIPEDFDMVVAPTPSLDGDVIPFEGIFAGAGEVFIVPSQANNVQGGKEWLRMLFSQEGGRFFSESTKSLTVVQGAAEGLELGTAFASTQDVIEAAGENTFTMRYTGWYPDLQEEASIQMGELMAQRISIDEYIDFVQEMADEVRDDPDIPKYTREV